MPDLADVTRSIKAAAEEVEPEADPWRPIETAPMDGTDVIVFDGLGVCVASFASPMPLEEWWEVVGDERNAPDLDGYQEYLIEECLGWVKVNREEVEYLNPYVWMPLPAPPQGHRP